MTNYMTIRSIDILIFLKHAYCGLKKKVTKLIMIINILLLKNMKPTMYI